MRIECKYCTEVLEGKISFSRHCLRKHKSMLDKTSLVKHYNLINKKNQRKVSKNKVSNKKAQTIYTSIITTPMK